MRSKAGALTGCIAMLVAGCGASSGGNPKSVVTEYLHALLRSDGGAACAMLSRATKSDYERSAHGRRCAQTLTAEAKRELQGQVRQRLAAARVVRVKVTGATAAATVSVPGRTSTISLVREGGGWKVENSPG